MKSNLTRWTWPFVLLALVVSACQPVTPGNGSTATPKATKSTTKAAVAPTSLPSIDIKPEALKGVTVEVWNAWYGAEAALFQSQIDKFNGTNQWGIAVRAVSQGNYVELFDSLSSAIQNGETPDLVVALPEQTLTWAAQDQVADLTPYVFDANFGLSQNERGDFPSVILAQDQVNGKWLGMPAERSARFLLYNQSWARELGFSAPPTTSADFRKQACAGNQTFKSDSNLQNDGYGGWIVDTDSYSVLSWLLAFGGGVVNGDKFQFASDPNQQALEFLKGLYDDNCAWVSTESSTYDQFAQREAIFTTASLGELPEVTKAFSRASNSDQWTVLPFPGDQGQGLVLYGPSYSLLKSTPEKQLAAWLFVRWLLSSDNQSDWVKSSGLLPLRVSEIPKLSDYKASHPQWAAAVALLPDGQIQPQLAGWRKVRPMLGDAVNSLFRVNLPVTQIPGLLKQMDTTASDLSQ
jgi:multiple sugar transport system substrate-binding protein